jgi:hypothetical protein
VVTPAQAGAVTNPSAGVYEYDYESHALDPSESYRIWFRFVASGFSDRYESETIQAADQSRTLRGLRRALFRSGKLGRYQLVTTSATPTGGDAARTLVSDELVDFDKSANAYDGVYAFLADGALVGQQRRASKGQFTNSTGTLLLARPFSGTVESGTVVELCFRLPAIAADGVSGIRECLNQALRVLPIPDRLTFTASDANQLHYDTDDYPWLLRGERLGAVYQVPSAATDNPSPWPGAISWRADASAPQLELRYPFNVGDTFQVLVARPAATWIRSGGTFGESTVGLVDDDDAVYLEPTIVIEAALAYAYGTLAELTSGDERNNWAEKAARQHHKAARLKADLLDEILRLSDQQETAPSRITTVVRPRSWGGRAWA